MRTMLVIWGRKTSACSRNVVVSDQLRTATLMCRPPCENPSKSTLVKGHGPAMQETLAVRDMVAYPASRASAAMPAFHLLSGEQGVLLLQGTFPVLGISKVLASVPIFSWVVVTVEYRMRMFAIGMTGRLAGRSVSL